MDLIVALRHNSGGRFPCFIANILRSSFSTLTTSVFVKCARCMIRAPSGYQCGLLSCGLLRSDRGAELQAAIVVR